MAVSEPSNSSGLLSATVGTQLVTGQFIITQVKVLADGTNTSTVTVYDGTSTADKVVALGQVKATDKEAFTDSACDGGIVCNKGIFYVVTGTGAQAIIYYRMA